MVSSRAFRFVPDAACGRQTASAFTKDRQSSSVDADDETVPSTWSFGNKENRRRSAASGIWAVHLTEDTWYNFLSNTMKGKYYLFLILAVVLGGIGLIAFDSIKAKKADEIKVESKDEVVLYWGEGCEHCKRVEEFLASYKEIEEKIKIEKKEVGKNLINSSELTERAKECKIDTATGVAVPFLYFRGECVTGDQPIINYLTNKTK